MLMTQAWDAAVKHRVVRDESFFKGTRVDLLRAGQGNPAPYAYMVEQQGGTVLRAHWHEQAQFQLVTAGAGTLGRHRVGPLTLHYASSESGYGPITADSDGLSYLTLRARADNGPRFMPESRERMRPGLERHHVLARTIERAAGATVRSVEEIATAPDGMRAWLVQLPAGDGFANAERAGDAARYYYVAGGEMRVAGCALGPNSVAFVHAEPGFTVSAGPAGLQLLVMQFPESATAGA